MEQATLEVIWFCLLGVLLAGYAVLDGFDLGVGIVHLLVPKGDHERRLALNSIGPLWDGNEVWLVTFGGALFAAFPTAYAAIFSGFYLAFMALLFALIFRAVSIEFRSKREASAWRLFWDVAFSVASTLATFLFGVAVGNALIGVPLDASGVFRGRLSEQLEPFPLLVGVFAVALFAMHGTIYLRLKSEGELRERARRAMMRTYVVFAVLFLATSVSTYFVVPSAHENLVRWPLLWVVPVLNVLAVLNIPRAIHRGSPAFAFVSSTAVILALVFLLGAELFPNLLVSRPVPENSLTIGNSSSSEGTLWIMLIIAVTGMPMVIAYTAVVYWTFRGKVKLDEHSY